MSAAVSGETTLIGGCQFGPVVFPAGKFATPSGLSRVMQFFDDLTIWTSTRRPG